MKKNFYKLECITNLFVGSSDINYNIVDNQVEKDATNGLPVIHASGIKGAIRERLISDEADKADVIKIFGDEGEGDKTIPGTYKFFDAMLITRPIRVYGDDNMSSINVATVESINNFIAMLNTLEPGKYDNIRPIGHIDFNGNKFLTNVGGDIKIEFDKTGKLPDDVVNELKKIRDIIGDEFAIAATFDDYDLPVIARNHLANRISKNLWYEEVVPHGSVFFFVVMAPDDCDILKIPEIMQFGGNSTIGCGFSRVTKL